MALAMRFAWLLFFAACSSAPVTSMPDAAVPQDSGLPMDDSGPIRSEACTAQDQALQAALDTARGTKSKNAMLAVKNEACGNTVYVSGDAQTANVDSLWRVGSVTKTWVSASILSLVKEGKVGLDDPLDKFVPNVAKSAGVTVRMLMGHRSGIYNYTEDNTFFADRTRVWKPREIVDFATMHDPYFAPNANIHYSNTNYILLGMILEAATGMKAGAALHARAIDVAGLKHTFFDGEDMLGGTLATGYNGTKDATHLGTPSEPWTAGAMVATGADIADWVWTLYGTEKVLDANQRMTLVANPSPLGSGVSYGLGVELTSAAVGGKAGAGFGHDGGIDGYLTMAFYFPDVKTSIAVVVNNTSADPNAILGAALDTLFP
jgi:D-alanyl-D-alanine carboxypeptidase